MPRISSPTVWTGSSTATSVGTTADAATTAGTARTGAAATGSALATAFLTAFLASTATGAATATGAGTTATATSTVSFLATRLVATLAAAGVEFIVLVPVEELEDILRTTIFFMSHLAQIFTFAFTFLLKIRLKIKKYSFFLKWTTSSSINPKFKNFSLFFALTENQTPG